MADLLLTRKKFRNGSTLGELHSKPAPGFLAHTLEKGVHTNRPRIDAIPAGTHQLRLREEGGYFDRYTKRWAWHREMVEIVVPGRTFILFHAGNYPKDTLGCILLGTSTGRHEGEFAVWQSAKAYEAAYPFIHKAAASGGKIEIVEAR